MFRSSPDIVVVGGGPVGLFAGLHVARRGHSVQIVDREWRPTAHSYALALHAESLRMLDDVGLLGPVLRRSRRIRNVDFYEGTERLKRLSLSALREDFSFLAVIRQDALEGLLTETLGQLSAKVAWNHDMVRFDQFADHIDVTIDRLIREGVGYAVEHGEWKVAKTRTEQVRFIIGADGHRSSVRQQLEIDWKETGPTRHFAVFEFDTDAELGDEVRIVLHDGLLNVLWPMPDGRCRWSFELRDVRASTMSRIKDRIDVQLGNVPYETLSEEALGHFLAERAPWFSGTADFIHWRLIVGFEGREAGSWGRDRAWLAGDAAHMTGPVGVQSMNIGLREARDLATRMCDILEGKAGFDALEAYEQERIEEWRLLHGLAGDWVLEEGAHPALAAVANDLLMCLPASGEGLQALASQLGLRVVEGHPA